MALDQHRPSLGGATPPRRPEVRLGVAQMRLAAALAHSAGDADVVLSGLGRIWLVSLDGQLVAEGPPSDVVTEDLVEKVFDLRCQVITDPVSHTPMVVPIGRHVNVAAELAPDARSVAGNGHHPNREASR